MGKKATDCVLVEGLRIGFRRAGSGPPLMLLHGGLGDSRAWRDQLEDLSDEFTVVAWDAPGCGGSADPPEDFRMADYADSLAGLIDALGLQRLHVLGHSFGAGLALELYRRHPDLPPVTCTGRRLRRVGRLPLSRGGRQAAANGPRGG